MDNKTEKILISSESVTEGHPDKMCDKISDAILDELLLQDKDSRVACETAAKNGGVMVFGEITTQGYVDIPTIVRNTLKDIGYVKSEYGIEYETASVWVQITEQSPDIAIGVDEEIKKDQGAGDQGMMYGYATSETPEYMPLPIILSHKLTAKLTDVRKSGKIPFLRPDGKSQVSVEYDESGKPIRVDTVVISTQHSEKVTQEEIRREILRHVIEPVCSEWLDSNTTFHINPTGLFVRGGPYADAGLTGRKIIVDTYGGVGRHGGGAFSGKDPSKVDRSAAYAARYIAKNIVASGLADKCEVQLAYAIGVAEPVSINIDTFGTGRVSSKRLVEIVRKHFPLTPKDIISKLELKRPIYYKTAAYGHFGRDDSDFTWEKTDKIEVLKKEISGETKLDEF